jgi:hypothetical protein
MSGTRCYEADELDEIRALPANHPRRRHAAGCPRCGALMGSYDLYLAAPDAAGARPAEAERALGAALERAMGAAAARSGHAAGPRREARHGWIERLMEPAFRPAWAFAGLALVLGAVLLAQRLPGPDREPAFRGPGETVSAVPVIERATLGPAGVSLRWTATAGADAYEVRLYGEDLAELARFDPIPGLNLEIAADQLPALAPGAGLIARVVALSGGDTVGTSAAFPIGR